MAERHHTKSGGLDTPMELKSRLLPSLTSDPDLFGRFAERFARYMGTANFLLYMTVFVVVWIAINVVGLFTLRWDPYPFILLNLFFSTQASYAAPLILLAQNRQDDRDRVQIEQDRSRNERNLADTEYLTREVAALRISLREVATRDFVRSELRSLLEDLIEIQDAAGADGGLPDDGDTLKEPRTTKRNPATSSIKTVAQKTAGAKSNSAKSAKPGHPTNP